MAETQVLKQNDSKGVILHKTIGNSPDAFILNRVVVEIDLGQLIFVLQNLTKTLCSLLSDIIAFKIQREQCIILFQSLGECPSSDITNIVILKTNLLK